MKAIFILLFSIFLSGCVTGKPAEQIKPGMSFEQVQNVMGSPDVFQKRDNFTIYKYTNGFVSSWVVSTWPWERTDYVFIFDDGKLVEYGAGEVRERTSESGVKRVFLY